MLRTHRFIVPATLSLLAAALTACSDVAGTTRVPVTLSVAGVGGAAAAAATTSPVFRAVAVTGGTNSIVITKAQVVLARVELERAAAASCMTTDDDRECEELNLDPMLVDLPLTATVQQALAVAVPAGTYSGLEAKIRAPRSGEDRTAAFLAAHPDFAGKSIHVEGTFNGVPFTYDGSAEGELELRFNPPMTVADGATNNITLHVDLSTWFRDGSGNVIDPSNAGNAALIADNIRRSFHAFEDHDRDGRDDHGGEAEGGEHHGNDG